MIIVQWILDHQAIIAGFGLFALSEIIALIPSLKSNSLIQLVINILKKLEGSDTSTPEVPPVAPTPVK